MNKRILAGLAIVALGAVSLGAQAGDRYQDRGNGHGHGYGHRDHDRGRARVLHVDPIVERVRVSVPVEHCWDEQVRSVRRADRTGAAIVGGAIGAVIGNRVSDGKGVGTVAGAIAGAAIGSELGRDGGYREVRYDTVRRCEVSYEEHFERQVVAYRVTYVHNGRRDVTRLAYDPGRYLMVAEVRRRG